MTKKDLHHNPPACPSGQCAGKCSCCPDNRRCRYSSLPIWFLYALFIIFVMASPVIVIFAINIWYINEDRPQPALVDAIYACAEEGSLHPTLRPVQPLGDGAHQNPLHNPVPPWRPSGDSDDWLERDLPEHPEGVCKEIKKIIHQSIHYCKDCAEEIKVPPKFKPPLVLGTVRTDDENNPVKGPTIRIKDNITCSGDLIVGIDIKNDGIDSQDTDFDGDDLDLPEFCPTSNEHQEGPNNNRRLDPANIPTPTREWELLERPRVHHTRTVEKPNPWNESKDGEKANKEVLVGGPYVVFVGKHLDGACCDKKEGPIAKRDKERITVFILYLDWVTEQPTIIEFDVEVERGKDVVSVEDTVQLISNVRLDSINKQITFQIGRGAQRLVVAGYDFSGQSTTTDVGRRRRSEEDTSGSYRIGLSDDAAVEWVQRLD